VPGKCEILDIGSLWYWENTSGVNQSINDFFWAPPFHIAQLDIVLGFNLSTESVITHGLTIMSCLAYKVNVIIADLMLK